MVVQVDDAERVERAPFETAVECDDARTRCQQLVRDGLEQSLRKAIVDGHFRGFKQYGRHFGFDRSDDLIRLFNGHDDSLAVGPLFD